MSHFLFLCLRFTLPEIFISNMGITQSVEAPLTTKDTVEIQGNIGNSDGVGSGTLTASYRRVISHKSWAEVCIFHLFKVLNVSIDFLSFCMFIIIIIIARYSDR